MSRNPPSSEDFSREESRYLDGELSADAMRRMERQLAADPERADRVEAYRAAMDVWREDAARTACGLGDGANLADRVVAAVHGGPEHPRLELQGSRAAPWYAAAAMALIGLGIAGTMLNRPTASPDVEQADLVEFEEAMVNLLIDSPEFSPPLAGSGDSK